MQSIFMANFLYFSEIVLKVFGVCISFLLCHTTGKIIVVFSLFFKFFKELFFDLSAFLKMFRWDKGDCIKGL